MNDYNKYKLKKFAEQLFEKAIDFIFYPLRKLYKENEKFKNWIDDSQNRRSKNQRIKKCLSNIFYDLDRNSNKQCVVFTFTDYDREYDWDREGWDYKYLIEFDEWIDKNKLVVDKYSFRDYVEKFEPKMLPYFRERLKDEIVMIIWRKI